MEAKNEENKRISILVELLHAIQHILICMKNIDII